MRCPRCGSEVVDTDAAFCARCGAPLGAAEGETTRELQTPADGAASATKEVDGPDEAGEEESPTASELAGAFVISVRRTVSAQRWADLGVAAGFGFLALLAAGSLLVLAGRLQFPELGSDADPFEVLVAMVIAGLATLRVSIHLQSVTASALPLVVLAFVGAALAWAVARAVRSSGVIEPREGAELGVRVALPFALICLAAALIFRIRGTTPIEADAGGAFLMGGLWGAFFGVLGGLWGAGETGSTLRILVARARERWPEVVDGAAAGGIMLISTYALAAAAGLVWLIGGLLTGGPAQGLGPAELIAAVIYLVAFAPNVLTSLAAVGFGAPIDFGAQITQRGRAIGRLQELSLFDWGGGDTPWYAFLLVAIPLLSCAVGGFYARRIARRGESMLRVVAAAAAVFALVLFEIAALSEARLGAGLVRARGVGLVAPREWVVLVLAFAWAMVVGAAGWKLGESRSEREPSEVGSEVP